MAHFLLQSPLQRKKMEGAGGQLWLSWNFYILAYLKRNNTGASPDRPPNQLLTSALNKHLTPTQPESLKTARPIQAKLTQAFFSRGMTSFILMRPSIQASHLSHVRIEMRPLLATELSHLLDEWLHTQSRLIIENAENTQGQKSKLATLFRGSHCYLLCILLHTHTHAYKLNILLWDPFLTESILNILPCAGTFLCYLLFITCNWMPLDGCFIPLPTAGHLLCSNFSLL